MLLNPCEAVGMMGPGWALKLWQFEWENDEELDTNLSQVRFNLLQLGVQFLQTNVWLDDVGCHWGHAT